MRNIAVTGVSNAKIPQNSQRFDKLRYFAQSKLPEATPLRASSSICLCSGPTCAEKAIAERVNKTMDQKIQPVRNIGNPPSIAPPTPLATITIMLER